MAKARKFIAGDAIYVNHKGPSSFRGRSGIINGGGTEKDEYTVEFRDGRVPHFGSFTATSMNRDRRNQAITNRRRESPDVVMPRTEVSASAQPPTSSSRTDEVRRRQ